MARILAWTARHCCLNGVLNSMEMVRLIGFIGSRFKVDVPYNMVLPEHFQNLTVLSNLIVELA